MPNPIYDEPDETCSCCRLECFKDELQKCQTCGCEDLCQECLPHEHHAKKPVARAA